MERAEVIVGDILQECLVQSSEQAIQAVDAAFVVRYMNRFMAELDADGVALGWTKITNIADFVTIPDGAINGLITNVALRIVSSYDIQPSQQLLISANESLKVMRKLGQSIEPTAYPDTLPIGSGNEWNTYRSDRFFAGEPGSQIENEQGGAIGLEANTNDE